MDHPCPRSSEKRQHYVHTESRGKGRGGESLKDTSAWRWVGQSMNPLAAHSQGTG